MKSDRNDLRRSNVFGTDAGIKDSNPFDRIGSWRNVAYIGEFIYSIRIVIICVNRDMNALVCRYNIRLLWLLNIEYLNLIVTGSNSLVVPDDQLSLVDKLTVSEFDSTRRQFRIALNHTL